MAGWGGVGWGGGVGLRKATFLEGWGQHGVTKFETNLVLIIEFLGETRIIIIIIIIMYVCMY